VTFDSQLQTLIDRGYPAALDLTPSDLTARLEPLRAIAVTLDQSEPDFEAGHIHFVIVIPGIDATTAMSIVERRGKTGTEKLFPRQPVDFQPTPDLGIPQGFAYLLTDIDRGRDSINVSPHDALIRITRQSRFPLTIHEGIACVTQYPEFLAKNNCYTLAGSRHPGDKRVPAIWINAKGNPHLGWCWDGNPHTWLGTASCARRFGFD